MTQYGFAEHKPYVESSAGIVIHSVIELINVIVNMFFIIDSPHSKLINYKNHFVCMNETILSSVQVF